MSSDEKYCFVLRPLGKDGTPIRTSSDARYNDLILPVCGYFGFKVEHAGIMASPTMITPAIIDSIVKADLVVADLTGRNPNVFYELSLRHALRKPCVTIASERDELPFDVKDCRTLFYDTKGNSSEAMEWTKDELRKTIIKALEEGDNTRTPISTGLDLLLLGAAGAMQRSVASTLSNTLKILDALSALDSGINVKVYELGQHLYERFNGINEEVAMELTTGGTPDREILLRTTFAIDRLALDLPNILSEEIGNITIGYLMELSSEKLPKT